MDIKKIKETLKQPEYAFLKEAPLGDSVILLGLGGSYAYGTNNEDSDLDIRGIAARSAKDILTGKDFEQVVDVKTDTTVYSLEKMVRLLSNCNPNTVEILGLEPWQYLYVSEAGQELIDNAEMFLSKKAVEAFGGYANSQLRRLQNRSVRSVGQAQREKHILGSIESARYTYPEKFFRYPEDAIRLYIDRSDRDDMETEIFMDVTLKHYPLRDYAEMWNNMRSIVKDYATIGKRNRKALEHGKISKHMCHTLRLFYMLFSILEEGKFITYRREEHDLLMDVRNGKFLDGQDQVLPEFYEIVDECEERLDRLKKTTKLPDEPDYDRINAYLEKVNRQIVCSRG